MTSTEDMRERIRRDLERRRADGGMFVAKGVLVALGLVVLLFSLSGCAMTGYEPHVRITAVEGSQGVGYGHGILLDSRHVLTVAHVTTGHAGGFMVSRASSHRANSQRVRYIRATVVKEFETGSIERYVLLRLSEPMHCDEFPSLRPIRPGDSGSPLLGTNGDVVGLLTGTIGPIPFIRGLGVPRGSGLVTIAPLPPTPGEE